MEIPSEILTGHKGVYTIEYQGSKYYVVIGDVDSTSPVAVTVHGYGSGGWTDTIYEQQTLLSGRKIEEALNDNELNITSHNQIDIFPVKFDGYYENKTNGQERITSLATEITQSISQDHPTVYMVQGHSLSSRGAIDDVIKYANNNPSTEQIIALYLEPSQLQSKVYSESDIQTMKDNNVLVIQARGNVFLNDMKQNVSNGMPVIDLFFDIRYANGGRTNDFEIQHRVPRVLLSSLDYSKIATGEFDWVNALGGDEDGYIYFTDEGNNYKIRVIATAYNIPGFENGEQVPLDVLQNYMSSLVMSDEEYLTSEIEGMETAVNNALQYINARLSAPGYSTSRIPAEAVPQINKLLDINKMILEKAIEAIAKIKEAGEGYVLLDEDLASIADATLNLKNMELETPTISKEEEVTIQTDDSSAQETGSSHANGTFVGGGGNYGTSPTPSNQGSTPAETKEETKIETKTEPKTEPKIEVIKDVDKKEDKKDVKVDEVIDENKNEEEGELKPEKQDSKPNENSNPVNMGNTSYSGGGSSPIRPYVERKQDSNTDAIVTPEGLVEVSPEDNQDVEIEIMNNDLPSDIIEIPDDTEIEPIEPVISTPETATSEKTSNAGLKGLGVAAGIGLAAGAAAYAAHKHMENKEYEDGYDYEYEDTNGSYDDSLYKVEETDNLNDLSGGEEY